MGLELSKSNDKGKTYQADGFKVLYRNKGSISGDNKENVQELMYLISGTAVVSVEDNSQIYEAPSTFQIPAKTHHKIEAKTNLVLIMFEKGQ